MKKWTTINNNNNNNGNEIKMYKNLNRILIKRWRRIIGAFFWVPNTCMSAPANSCVSLTPDLT